MKKKWDLQMAGVTGGVIGFIVSVFGPMATGQRLPWDTFEAYVNVGAGVLLCAVVGVVIALIRNAVVKAT